MLARLLTGLFVVSVASVPGSGALAHASTRPLPPRLVVAGHLLEAKPPAFAVPVRGYRLTGRFGAGSHLWSTVHTGLDFAAPSGTEVRAVGTGRIVEAAYDGRYGNKAVLRLTDGTELWFCHLGAFTVSVGDRVRAGEVIGHVGSTGNTTGPHLHLEVRPRGGDPVDPAAWLESRRLRLS